MHLVRNREKATFAAMPARKKRAESALKCWKKGKENASPKSTNRRLLLKQGLDWDWTGDGLEHFSFLTHLNNYFLTFNE